MPVWSLALPYSVLPWLAASYGVITHLLPRLVSVKVAWIGAAILTTLFILAAVLVIGRASGGIVPLRSMLKAYAALYGIPLLVLTAIALRLRGRADARSTGLILMLVLTVTVSFASRYVSGYFLDFVEASA